ncbi:23S rRNA (guanosine(2251)-2'-O)-methyltransferase RlmB [Archangium gephyra]|nr:23S rRNA (guanosine(2251)-2'-O)-methyltransferase RlmB [Archangium gephyra]
MRQRSSRGSERGEQRGERGGGRERGAERERSEQRYVYGVNPVLESLRAHAERVERLFVTEGQLAAKAAAEIFSRARDTGIRVERVPRERLAAMADGGVHQGVVAELRGFEYAELEDLLEAAGKSGHPALLVVLDGIQDPHNFGAIIRSAHAMGAHGVVIAKDRAVPVTGVVAKASAGAVEHCPIARVVNLSRALEELKEAGVWIAAADPHSNQPLWSARLDGPLALVVGAEGAGVRPGVLEHCDFRLGIPMLGQVGSLNASVSAAILLYEAARQRGTSRPGAGS